MGDQQTAGKKQTPKKTFDHKKNSLQDKKSNPDPLFRIVVPSRVVGFGGEKQKAGGKKGEPEPWEVHACVIQYIFNADLNQTTTTKRPHHTTTRPLQASPRFVLLVMGSSSSSSSSSSSIEGMERNLTSDHPLGRN
jgi:hypothetical protein